MEILLEYNICNLLLQFLAWCQFIREERGKNEILKRANYFYPKTYRVKSTELPSRLSLTFFLIVHVSSFPP